MKKLIIAFSFMLFVGSLAAANSMEQPIKKVVTVESNKQTKGKTSKSEGEPCVKCIWWPGGGCCGAGETCEEALDCLILCLQGD